MKFPSPRLTILLSSAILFLGLATFVLLNFGTWLLVSDPLPESADVIFTFCCNGTRTDYSIDLAKKYPNAKWIMSGQCNRCLKKDLLKNGIDTTRTVFLGHALNTYSELQCLKLWIDTSKVAASHVVLISSPFHMRRISFLVRSELPKSIRISLLPVPFGAFGQAVLDYRHWWMSAPTRKNVLEEMAKIPYDLVRASLFQRVG